MVSTNLNKEHFMWRSSWNFYFWISLIDNLVDIIIAMVQIMENANHISIIAHGSVEKYVFDICCGWEPALDIFILVWLFCFCIVLTTKIYSGNASIAKETGEAIFVTVYIGICGVAHKEILKIRWLNKRKKKLGDKKKICG
eukprot:445879_1